VSPLGGDPVQATFLEGGTYKPWWHAAGNFLISISAGSIYATNVMEGDPDFGKSLMLTEPTPDAPPDAIVFSPDGDLIGFNRTLDGVRQVFVATFVPESSTFVLAALAMFGAIACIRRPR
jgi:hypothetical protein